MGEWRRLKRPHAAVSSPRMVSMTGVNGWFCANQRTRPAWRPPDERAADERQDGHEQGPAGALANRPSATVSQVSAKASRANSPAAAIQAGGPATDRKPSASAIATTRTPLSMVRITLPATVPVSTDVRAMGMVRNRSMMLSQKSVLTDTAVDSAAKPTAITQDARG